MIKEGNLTTEAAGICRNYKAGGFNDWYLPSQDEFQKIVDTLKPEWSGFYWTSTEKMNGSAWGYDFTKKAANASNKGRQAKVRAIRAF